MVQSKTFRFADTNRPIAASEVDEEKQIHIATGKEVKSSWEKMSKSKFNGVDPQAMVDAYGADATRLYVLFRAPPRMALEWDESGIKGMERWLGRLWKIVHEKPASSSSSVMDKALGKALNDCIAQVTLDLDKKYGFNTAIASLMTLSNVVKKTPSSTAGWVAARDARVVMLAPFAPHFSAESWSVLHPSSEEVSVFSQKWPSLVELQGGGKQDEGVVSVTVLVNGKKRSAAELDARVLAEGDKDVIFSAVEPLVKKWITTSVERIISVPKQRMINIVTRKK
jgi:leucyl-tRNA synthetase